MRFDNRAARREAKAGAARFCRTERPEKLIAHTGRHTESGVGDAGLYLVSIARHCNANEWPDGSLSAGVAGILYQGEQDMLNSYPIDVHGGQSVGYFNFQLTIDALREHLENRLQFSNEIRHLTSRSPRFVLIKQPPYAAYAFTGGSGRLSIRSPACA
jgi:hypothetical protein